MGFIFHFTLGFVTSFAGSITPSMLNISAVKWRINKNKQAAIHFSIGVSLVVLIQAYVVILFTKFLSENPSYMQGLQKIAIAIFVLLSVYFYKASKKEKGQVQEVQQKAKNSFLAGLGLSALNMFSVSFYCGVTTALDMAGWVQFTQNNTILFAIGSSLGTFVLLYAYINFAKVMQQKSNTIAQNLNLILSVLTGVVALLAFFNL